MTFKLQIISAKYLSVLTLGLSSFHLAPSCRSWTQILNAAAFFPLWNHHEWCEAASYTFLLACI